VKQTIAEMQQSLLGALSSLGDIANNLGDAARWVEGSDEAQSVEEARCCLESVNMATSDALEKLLAISTACQAQLGEGAAS
jgi:hypothetical protein